MKFVKVVKKSILLLICYSGLNTVFAQDLVSEYGYRILNTYPHDIEAFTQGLIFHDGYLFEGTGKRGQSSLSKINLDDATVLMSKNLSRRYFGCSIFIYSWVYLQRKSGCRMGRTCYRKRNSFQMDFRVHVYPFISYHVCTPCILCSICFI